MNRYLKDTWEAETAIVLPHRIEDDSCDKPHDGKDNKKNIT